MVFSLVTPSISIDRITDFARNISGQRTAEESSIARSLGLENQSGDLEVDRLDTVRVGGLPNQHLIGSGSELSEQVVMVVGVESPQGEALQSPLYLRSLVYDKYTGQGWESRSTEIVTYSAGEELLAEKPLNAYPVRQQVQFIQDLGGFIYTVGDPNSVDQDFKVAWRVRDFQIGIFDTLGATVDADSYRADSYVRMQSAEELRSAGQGYPDWVRDRYMNLPPAVPENVLALAIELTATGATPFDRAVAIEQYLRVIPYSLDVSTGPAGADIVEYFLFRLQKGYCDYYASAMVVLARAAGIPARYVVGYIGEYYDESEDVYIITADQAHAWAEVYFPDYGWVPFEPTGGRPAMDRPIEPIPELPDEFEFNFSPLVPEKGFSVERWLPVFGIGPIIFIILVWFGLRISDWWLTRLDLELLIPRLYKRIYGYARWAGIRAKPGDTAYRFADSLISYLTQLGEQSHWSEWILEGIGMIQELTTIFVQYNFSPQKYEIDPGEILLVYKQLRTRLWLLLLLGKAYPYLLLRPFLWENLPLLIPMPLEEK
jgi:transglutaminase-like putative cysteine protease